MYPSVYVSKKEMAGTFAPAFLDELPSGSVGLDSQFGHGRHSHRRLLLLDAQPEPISDVPPHEFRYDWVALRGGPEILACVVLGTPFVLDAALVSPADSVPEDLSDLLLVEHTVVR